MVIRWCRCPRALSHRWLGRWPRLLLHGFSASNSRDHQQANDAHATNFQLPGLDTRKTEAISDAGAVASSSTSNRNRDIWTTNTSAPQQKDDHLSSSLEVSASWSKHATIYRERVQTVNATAMREDAWASYPKRPPSWPVRSDFPGCRTMRFGCRQAVRQTRCAHRMASCANASTIFFWKSTSTGARRCRAATKPYNSPSRSIPVAVDAMICAARKPDNDDLGMPAHSGSGR